MDIIKDLGEEIKRNHPDLFNNPLWGCLAVDKEGMILATNETFPQWLKYDQEEELIGRCIFDKKKKIAEGNAEERHRDRLENNGKNTIPIGGPLCEDGNRRYRCKDGSLVITLTHDEIVVTSHNQKIVIKTLINITDKIRAYEILPQVLSDLNINDLDKMLKELTERIATTFMHVPRLSIVIDEERNDEFILKAGYPAHAHGVGNIMEGDTKKIIEKAIAHKDYIYIDDPVNSDLFGDQNKHFAKINNISAILFLPIFINKHNISGALIMDKTNGQKFSPAEIGKAKFANGMATNALNFYYEAKKFREKEIREERLITLAQHAKEATHTFRHYLTVIGGNVRVIKKFINKIRKHLEEIGITTNHELNELFETLNDPLQNTLSCIFRTEATVSNIWEFASNEPLQKETINAHTFLKVCLDEFEEKTTCQVRKGCEINIDLDKSIKGEEIYVDIELLKNALINLLINAEEAVNTAENIPQKIINISAQIQNDQLTITISNNGNTIPEPMKDKIFNPFFTRDTTGKNRKFGLGLSNAKIIIEKHDGSIKLETPPGLTQFKIKLPVNAKLK